jgi:carbon-monoxide dehydrogenase medium subunit
MFTTAFEYVRPKSLEEATAALQKYGFDGKVLAGGQSLIPAMRLRLAALGALVDINGLPDMRYTREENGHLRVGALARHVDFEHSSFFKEQYPLLSDAAHWLADPVIRNWGTMVGSVVHNDPAGDWGAVAMAMKASIVLHSASGERTMPVSEFCTDTFTTEIQEGEIAVALLFPKASKHSAGAYIKLERKVGDYAIVAAGTQLTVDATGKIAEAGIAFANAAPMITNCTEAENILTGQSPSDDLFKAAAEAAANATDPAPDNRGTVEYKKDMARVLCYRALKKSYERIQQHS